MRNQLLSLWPTQSEVTACIKTEAEAIDEAVFLAVHQAMSFQRRDVGSGGATVPCSESDLLSEFMSPDLPEGRMILPIVGSSGIGKSHVIRWIDAQLRRTPDAKRLHIIRVPKGSSLKGVLRLLLHNLKGSAFDRIREALSTARDHLEPEKAARQLQLSLRYRLEQEAKAVTQRLARGDIGGTSKWDEEVRAFGSPSMLPALLGDPLLEQQHWLTRLDGRPGVLALMAEQVTQEGGRDVDKRRHEFVPDDFVLPNSIDLRELSAQAHRCYGYLERAGSERREAAARVLNRVLDEAKNDLLQLGDNTLVELFGEVRSELFRQKRELVFLVEDFAALSGLQGALLQVMIAEATRDGRQTLCTMRSALAYTEGYMAGRDTVLTRAKSEWLLVDRPGEDSDIFGRIERLVGAYLNAARVGQRRLHLTYKTGAAGDTDKWVPSAGLDDLEPESRSVVEAFGRSEDGYPLFPFNRAAVRQLARRGCIDARGVLYNPRLVINNILFEVLKERPTFERGDFPPYHLASSVRSAEVTNEVGHRVPVALLNRYLGVLHLWGDQPESVPQAAAMHNAVYRAFGLSPVDFGVKPEVRSSQAEQPQGRRSSTETTSNAQGGSTPDKSAQAPTAENSEERRWRNVLEAWADGEPLIQSDARDIRKWIAEAMLAFLPTDALLLRVRQNANDLRSKVYVPRSRGQGNLQPDSAFVVVASEEDFDDPLRRAAITRTLLALARRYGIHMGWNYDGAEIDGGLLRDFLAEGAPAAADYVRRHHFQVDAPVLEPLVCGLMVGARALGIVGANDRAGRAAILAALLESAPEQPKDAAGPWAELQTAITESRPTWREMLLELVGARQGGAASVHAVDAPSLLSAIGAVRGDWKVKGRPEPSTNDAAYAEFVRSFGNLQLQMEKAVREEQTVLKEWLPGAVAFFGEELDKTAIQKALRDLVTDVKKRGLVPGASFDDLRKQLTELPTIALVEAHDAARLLARDPSRGEVLSLLATLPGRHLAKATSFVRQFETFLVQVDQALSGREAAVADDVVERAVEAVGEVLEGMNELLRAFEESEA